MGVMVKLRIILLVKLKGAYWCQRLTTGAVALCAKRLMKLTPDAENFQVHYLFARLVQKAVHIVSFTDLGKLNLLMVVRF